MAYPKWKASYSGEEFDRIQRLALELTDKDRRAGRLAPAVGYSGARFEEATKIVRGANEYGKNARSKNADAYAVEQFERWFQQDGHWIYPSRERAMEVWCTRGIDGLPPCPKSHAKHKPNTARNQMRRNPDEFEIARTAPILNADEFDTNGDSLIRLWFGQVGTTFLYYFGSVEDGFDAAVEWADDNAPGLLSTIGLAEYKEAAEDEGIEWNDDWPDFEDPDFQKVVERAEADMTIIGHTTLENGNAVASYEWGVDDVHGKERDIVVARAAPYTYRMSYEVVTEESAAEGEAAESGWEVEEPEGPFTLDDLVRAVNDHSWIEWSSSPARPGDWLTSDSEQNYSTGEETRYSLFIERVDKQPLTIEEMKEISKELGVVHARFR